MMPGSNQGQGPNGQGSALGMNSLHVGPVGSPTMNRMEGGGEQGVERNTGVAGNSPTGTAMQANAAVGNAMTTPAPGLVGAGSLVGTAGHILPQTECVWHVWTHEGRFNGPQKLWVEPDFSWMSRSWM